MRYEKANRVGKCDLSNSARRGVETFDDQGLEVCILLLTIFCVK